MSQQKKFKFSDLFRPRAPEAPAAEVPPKETAQVRQLIANGKAGAAVDIAKGVHKRMHNAASEELLVDAYAARITSLAERNLAVEAKALLDMVLERHPSARERLREVTALLKALTGGVDAWLELLADATLPAEKAVLEGRIRGAANDPGRIARSGALPPEHPLRAGAAAVTQALGAVTSGPVAAEAVALGEVSHHSPMAPWKMLVRAVEAFYRNEDALCEKYLAAVEPTAPAARVAPALRAMMGQKPTVTLTPAAQSLVKQAGGGLAVLRATLITLDQALEKKNYGLALAEMGRAVALCKEACPDLLERLKQQISVRAMMAGAKADRVTSTLGGPTLKNANFWRLLARGYEEDPHDPMAVPEACSAWEEFRRHAIREKWFPAAGPEVATLYLHMAELWRRIPEEQTDFVGRRFAAGFQGNRVYYAGQPPEIRDLMPSAGRQDLYYLEVDNLFQRACEADPCAENFQRWLNLYLSESRKDRRVADEVAARWSAARPKDIPPVLHLMRSAEKSNALKKAFKLMERAEQLDGLNPDVRKARMRLLISLVTRHLQQKKTHLAEPELRQIEALPQARQGDRPALAAALRWVWHTLREEAGLAEAAREAVVRQMGGEMAAHQILKAVGHACKLKVPVAKPKSGGAPLAAALGRACALGEDMGLEVEIPPVLADKLIRELKGDGAPAEAAGLAALGEAALRGDDVRLAYAVSTAGLRHGQEKWAEFLFLRARALPGMWAGDRQGLCAAAAGELARRYQNADLLRRIGEWREEEMISPDVNRVEVAMSTQQLDELMRKEKAQLEYPVIEAPTRYGGADRMPYDDDEDCPCPVCVAKRGGLPPELAEVMGEMEEMMEEMGPDAVLRALGEMIGGGPGKRRRRRARAVSDDDLPF